jgi:hypothetical protein
VPPIHDPDHDRSIRNEQRIEALEETVRNQSDDIKKLLASQASLLGKIAGFCVAASALGSYIINKFIPK